jgi:RNA polymerase sigma-32 factor
MHFDSKTQLELLKKWRDHGESEALNLLIKSNEKIIAKMAMDQHLKSGLDIDDLKQEAMLGMLIAAEKFDFERNVSFLTYASNWMRQRMTKFTMNNRSTISFGKTRDSRELYINFGKTWASLSGRKMTLEQKCKAVAEKLGVKEKNVLKYYQVVVCGQKRMDAVVSDEGGATFGEMIEDEGCDISKSFEEKDTATKFRQAVEDMMKNEMTKRESDIIRYRYFSGDIMSYPEIAKKVGCSRQNVTNIDKKLISRIQEMSEEKFKFRKEDF